MRISERLYQLLALKMRVQRELETALAGSSASAFPATGRGRLRYQGLRTWRLLRLRQHLRAAINNRMTHPIRLH